MKKSKPLVADQLGEIEMMVRDLTHHYVVLGSAQEASNCVLNSLLIPRIKKHQYVLIDLDDARYRLVVELDNVVENLKILEIRHYDRYTSISIEEYKDEQK